MSIPAVTFQPIIDELQRRPLCTNKYRLIAGTGKSQTFGVVNRRSAPPDYSRLNWMRPYLYKLLLEFAAAHVTIPWTSITVNQNYKAAAHRDKGNRGESYLVAFGSYTGGELRILEGPLKGDHDVKHSPLITDFSKCLHEVQDFTGDRYSLVFYTHEPRNFQNLQPLPPPAVEQIGTKWYFKRGDEVIRDGLPHPLKGRTVVKVSSPATVTFE